MRLILTSLAAAAALTACAEQEPPSAPAEEAPAPAPVDPRPAPPTGPEAPATQIPADACGAAEHQDWIGRARSDLPPPEANWRIYETGQPVTQDLRPDRLNIEIDPDNQTVVRIRCG